MDAVAQRRVECPFAYIRGCGETIVLDVSRQATGVFGMHHGQRYRVTSGDLAGEVVVILGVYQRALWRYVEVNAERLTKESNHSASTGGAESGTTSSSASFDLYQRSVTIRWPQCRGDFQTTSAGLCWDGLVGTGAGSRRILLYLAYVPGNRWWEPCKKRRDPMVHISTVQLDVSPAALTPLDSHLVSGTL